MLRASRRCRHRSTCHPASPSHPCPDDAEPMLDRLAPLTHLLGMVVEAGLRHGRQGVASRPIHWPPSRASSERPISQRIWMTLVGSDNRHIGRVHRSTLTSPAYSKLNTTSPLGYNSARRGYQSSSHHRWCRLAAPDRARCPRMTRSTRAGSCRPYR
jgi:hypothetical protein